MKNYGLVLKDTSVIIALCIQSGEVAPIKTLYRSAQALVALERWTEAGDVIKRAKEIPGEAGKAEWKTLEEKIESSLRKEMERKERIRREKMTVAALDQAIKVSLIEASLCEIGN